jgi:hypothetical protein
MLPFFRCELHMVTEVIPRALMAVLHHCRVIVTGTDYHWVSLRLVSFHVAKAALRVSLAF